MNYIATCRFDDGSRKPDPAKKEAFVGKSLAWEKGEKYTGPNAARLLKEGLVFQVEDQKPAVKGPPKG